MNMDSDWTIVVRKGRKPNTSLRKPQALSPDTSLSDTNFDALLLKENLFKKQNNIEQQVFWNSFLECQERIITEFTFCQELVLYGIGHFAFNFSAQFQLAFAICLQRKLQPKKTLFYDPVCSPHELSFLKQELGIDVVSFNEEGKRRVTEKSFFFMPHCGKRLYSNLLWKNWKKESLENIAILGNTFFEYTLRPDYTPKTFQYVNRILPYVSSVPLLCSPAVTDSAALTLNDLSLHFFPPQTLATAPPEIWKMCEEDPSPFAEA
eukprot:GCRY01003805.1.p1 GENE.GCRY01003805.1~~GCRY01003805.1.p1  ORF type:complete len:264 (+),score=23.13 GCRY01003805.1:142-933(+)